MTKENNLLNAIKIQGFKSIKDLHLVMHPVNILIGANGSGKSNFISIFTFLRNLSEGRLQNYVEQCGGAERFFYFGSKTTKEILIDLKLGNADPKNQYQVTFQKGSEDSLFFKSEVGGIDTSIVENNGKNFLKPWKMRGENGESGLLPGSNVESEGIRSYVLNYIKELRVYHFHDTGPSAAFKQTANINSNEYLYKDAENLAAFLYRLKKDHEKSYKEIVSAVQTVTPFFHDFYLEPNNSNILLKWTHKNHDNPFLADQLSDGTARLMCLATLFLQPKELRPQTILLDEPELGLHPAGLAVLADLIKQAAKTTQVICSTQSVTLANHFAPEDFIVADQENGCSSFRRVTSEEIKQWLDEFSMGDIWNKNLIGGQPEW